MIHSKLMMKVCSNELITLVTHDIASKGIIYLGI
jgi:hypothetical protein